MSKEQQQRRWTPDEDKMLREGFRIQLAAPGGKGRTINWNEIAKKTPDRSNKDCRKRYYNNMVAGLKKGSWTEEEDSRLRACIDECGLAWAVIAQKMENRSADQCSKRWHHCLDPGLERQAWTEEENQRLRAAVATHGSSWKDIQTTHFPTRSANNVKNQYTILSGKHASAPSDLPPCCPQRQSNLPEASSNQADVCVNHEVPGDNSYDFMAIDNQTPVPELTEDWSTDFGSFLDDIPFSDFSDPWRMSKTELDDIFNTPPESVRAMNDLPYFPTNSSVVDSRHELPRQNFDAQNRYLNGNQSAPLDLHDYGSIFSQRIPSNFSHDMVDSDLDRTAKYSSMQANVVRRNDPAHGSRAIITIDNAESETVMEVMRVLVASKAKVNFQSA